ncbi:MAG: hypothetical protein H3C30_19735, partial [Candidatus Hydrogenedentes bacterium]|nr:hypothetical protein [Candidatus Hydrogenedentota bacterium]
WDSFIPYLVPVYPGDSALYLALVLFQRSGTPIGHGKIIEHQKAMKFPVVEMPSKMTGHTPAAGEEAAVCRKPDSLGDLEQEQEQDK